MRKLWLWLLRYLLGEAEEAEQTEKREKRAWKRSAGRFNKAADRWRKKRSRDHDARP